MSKLLEKDETHWQWYKGFFGITVLRYLVTWFALVPIFAKLFSDWKFKVTLNNEEAIDFHSKLSIPFTLEILWLASLLFVIALLLYQFFCPRFIKTYSSYGDYKKHEHSPRWIVHEALKVINDENELPKLFERLSTKEYLKKETKPVNTNDVKVETYQTVAYFNYNKEPYSLGLPIIDSNNIVDSKKTEIAEQEIFWEIFGRFSSSRAALRLIIIILLIISAGLFFFTLCEHIWSGIKILIAYMCGTHPTT
jgi:hypothetical protein